MIDKTQSSKVQSKPSATAKPHQPAVTSSAAKRAGDSAPATSKDTNTKPTDRADRGDKSDFISRAEAQDAHIEGLGAAFGGLFGNDKNGNSSDDGPDGISAAGQTRGGAGLLNGGIFGAASEGSRAAGVTGALRGPLAAAGLPFAGIQTANGIEQIKDGDVFNGVSDLVGGGSGLVSGGAGIAAAAGVTAAAPVAIGAAGVAAGADGVKTLVNGIQEGNVRESIAGGLKTAGGGLALAGVATGNPVLVAAGGGAYLGGLATQYAPQIGEAIGDGAEAVGGAVKDGAEAVGNAIGDGANAVKDKVGDALDSINPF